ncbi:MAG: hypothetical protein R2745_09755 [Vicinamibacterales bacterium]
MRRALLAFVLGAAVAGSAEAQAWLPPEGETSVSFVLSDSYVREHDLNGIRDPNGRINSESLLADVTYGVRDNLAVSVSLPVMRVRFTSLGTPPHPTELDNGAYHTTAADIRVDVRYTLLNRRTTVITPFVTTVTPSHDYEYFAHAAPGRRVNEVQVGAFAGLTLDALPGMFVQARYGYGFQEKFVGYSHNRSLFSLESGYFVTPDVRVFGMVNGQVTHGGLDFAPGQDRTLPPSLWANHDRVARENFVNVGGGLGWSISDTVDVFGSFSKAVSAVNTHVLDRAIVAGVSIRVLKSAAERGKPRASLGNRIARCACQKGLSARR